MPDPDRFREAATIRVQAPVDHVRELLSNPNVLETVDERLTEGTVEVSREGDLVEVSDREHRLHLAFRLRSEGEATRVAAREDVEPQGILEQTKHWLFPSQAHRDLEEELDRFRVLAEALATESSA